jgi:hypothetical protein
LSAYAQAELDIVADELGNHPRPEINRRSQQIPGRGWWSIHHLTPPTMNMPVTASGHVELPSKAPNMISTISTTNMPPKVTVAASVE